MSNTTKVIQSKLDKIAELNLNNEEVLRDSIVFRNAEKNNEEITKISEEVVSIMEKYKVDGPISSQDGTFIAYPKRIGMSGVDMEKVMATGLFQWFMMYHPECFVLDLRKAEETTGMDLSGYAVRGAYTMYTISTDDDYKTVVKIIDEYKEKKDA